MCSDHDLLAPDSYFILSLACVRVPFNVAAGVVLDSTLPTRNEKCAAKGCVDEFNDMIFSTVIYATCTQTYVHAQNIDKPLYVYVLGMFAEGVLPKRK